MMKYDKIQQLTIWFGNNFVKNLFICTRPFAVFDFTKKKTRTVRFVEMLHVYMKSNQPTLLWKAGY